MHALGMAYGFCPGGNPPLLCSHNPQLTPFATLDYRTTLWGNAQVHPSFYGELLFCYL